jgi:hypothetical protein
VDVLSRAWRFKSSPAHILKILLIRIFNMCAGASKLLYLRRGLEQRSHVFLARKTDELVARQNFLKKKF